MVPRRRLLRAAGTAAAHADVDNLRIAWWTIRAGRRARRQLRRGGPNGVTLPAVPVSRHLDRGGGDRVVSCLCRVQRLTCLESVVVRRQYLSTRGENRAIVVGVTAPEQGFAAHAWLEGEDPAPSGYVRLGTLMPEEAPDSTP